MTSTSSSPGSKPTKPRRASRYHYRVTIPEPALRFGMSAFVIARSTDSDAQEAFDEAWELAEREHPGSASRPIGGANGSAVMFTALAEHPHIGTNGGTAAGLIGSYGTVASRIIQFYEAGIDTFLLQAQPLGAELARFAGEVVPRVRARLGASAQAQLL